MRSRALYEGREVLGGVIRRDKEHMNELIQIPGDSL